jgi:cytochrome c biogenesis protein CcdA
MQGIVEALFQIAAGFGTGFYVAISPCLFPLLPMVLIKSLQSENSRSRSLQVTLVLVLGILVSLAIFAIISSAIGYLLSQYRTVIQAWIGALIVFVGIIMLVERLRRILRLDTLSLVSQPTTPTGLAGVFTIGLTYSLLAAPCSAPALVGFFAVLTLSGTAADLAVLGVVFLAVSIGVALPYLTIGLATGEARQRMANTFARNARKVEILVGVLLVALGLFLMAPYFQYLLSLSV